MILLNIATAISPVFAELFRRLKKKILPIFMLRCQLYTRFSRMLVEVDISHNTQAYVSFNKFWMSIIWETLSIAERNNTMVFASSCPLLMPQLPSHNFIEVLAYIQHYRRAPKSKSFHNVWHKILLDRLSIHDISKSVFTIIKSLLTDVSLLIISLL